MWRERKIRAKVTDGVFICLLYIGLKRGIIASPYRESNMFLFLLLVVSILLVVYTKIKYFTLRGPLPGLSPHFFFGNVLQSGILTDNLSFHQVFSAFKNRFGDIFQFWLGPWRIIVVSSITDVQHIYAFMIKAIYSLNKLVCY
jgi:hypothetical protein